MSQCFKCLKFICLENLVEDPHLFDLTGCVYLLIIQLKPNYKAYHIVFE